MAARGVARGGRGIVAILLIGFVLVATGVIWRRGEGIRRARELQTLDEQQRQLRALRGRLERDVRELSTRSRLGAVAESRLGMRVPNDSQVIILQRPPQP